MEPVSGDSSPTRSGKLSVSESSPLRGSRTPWRNLAAYWLLGLCNNYGYVVMLSAAHDILGHDFHPTEPEPGITTTPAPSDSVRDCNHVSTGAILLADILPSLCIKLSAPFFPFHVHVRMVLVIALSAAGFLLVALGPSEWVAILGVVATSLGSGLGEVTLLSYSNRYDNNVISTWSSGTGGAGILGSLSYAGLTQAGVTPGNSLLIMLVVPALMAVSFWLLLLPPTRRATPDTGAEGEQLEVVASLRGFGNKLHSVPPLLKYMVPLGAVYLFEYFINQGLFELVEFRGIWLDHKDQYRWLQVTYQIGVFISRSSVNLVVITHIWLMAVLQLVNVLLFTAEAVWLFIPSIWIVFALVLWEGLLGGAAYVNTFYRISKEVPAERREFSMGITSLADAVGIGIAGMVSIPVHNALCSLPRPTGLRMR